MTVLNSVPIIVGYDDIVSFARAMYEADWHYTSEPGSLLLDYFEAPHKWEPEYRKWCELGGTLDTPCIRALEHWLDHRNDPVDDEEEA